MNEPTLFDMGPETPPAPSPPRSHRADPVTSTTAAEKLARSGRCASQKENVLEALRHNNGATSVELAAYLTVDRYLTARRLPDLERDGRARQGEMRHCRVTGTPCVTWWITK